MRKSRKWLLILPVLVLAIVVIAVLLPKAPVLETVRWASLNDWAPDGAISRVGDRWYFSSGTYGRVYDPDLGSGWNQDVIGPSNIPEAFDQNYAAPGSVLQINGKWFMFYHGESHECAGHFPFHAGIGLATSEDGYFWTRQGQILSTWEERPACQEARASGVGYPSAVQHDGYIYLYFVSWTLEEADATHVARCEVERILASDCWKKYFQGDWVEPGLGGHSTQVLSRSSEEELYLATPQVQLINGEFRGIFETNLGFVTATSQDGIMWSEPQTIFAFPKPHTEAVGEDWYSYPSLVEQDGQWWLYMARQNNQGVHHMHRIAVTLP